MDYNSLSLKMHEENKGKVEVISKVKIKDRDDLSTAYTPGVAEPCRKIRDNKADVYKYTCKGNMVAVVSDGTAVLGLGDIGPEAAIPVMEGKSILFKEFGNVDAFPICLDTKDVDEIVETVKRIAPVFGGINLEDISAPRCFEIERRLKEELDIPVFHDDQHGTAIIVLAGVLNALKVVGKRLEDVKIVQNGPGAAGTAIIKMLQVAGAKNIVAVDEHGILYPGRPAGLADHKEWLATVTNPEHLTGTVYTARDAAHARMNEALDRGEPLPFDIKGAAIYYVGPTPERPGCAIGAAGPTTSGRMDKFTPRLLDLGLACMIGKGKRDEAVKAAVVRNGAVYLAAIGGAGALMAGSVKSCEIIAWPDLGCEAVRRLEVVDMPLTVLLDAHGGNLYQSGPQAYLQSLT